MYYYVAACLINSKMLIHEFSVLLGNANMLSIVLTYQAHYIGTFSELKVSPHDLNQMALETTYEVKVNETYLSK